MDSREFFGSMYENFVNGNLEDFKKQVKGLTKRETFLFVQYLQGYTTGTAAVINYLAKSL